MTRLVGSAARRHAGGNGAHDENMAVEGQAAKLMEDSDCAPLSLAGSCELNAPGTICTEAEESHVVDDSDDENVEPMSIDAAGGGDDVDGGRRRAREKTTRMTRPSTRREKT